MGRSISVQAYAGRNSKIFQKHHAAVKFCVENELSFPKETSEFFKGKVGGDNLEDLTTSAILEYIENGVEVGMPMDGDEHGYEYTIDVSAIPPEVDHIVIKMN